MTDLWSEAAERAVVGAMLHGADLAREVAELVAPTDFHFGYCRRIYEAAGNVAERGDDTDTITVADEIERGGTLEDIGGAVVLADLSLEAVPGNIYAHVAIVSDRSRRRRLLGRFTKTVAAISDTATDVEDTLAAVEGYLRDDTARSAGIEFVSYEQLTNLPEQEWEAIGLVPRGITVIFGADQAGKSFLALDLACRMASGGGRMVGGWRIPHGGPVAYVAAEGQAGIRKRVDAWVAHHGDIPSELWVHGKPVDMLDPASVSEMSRRVGRMGARLLVVDTLGRCFGDGDENNTADMTRFINSLDRIRTANNCSVIVIHHSGWEESRIRGNAKLKRDCDGMIGMREVGDVREIVCHKVKDAPRFDPWTVRMQPSGESVVLVETGLL